MKIDTVKTVRIDDLKNAGGEIPAWLEPLVYQINGFFESVGKAVQGNVTFADNISSKIKTYKLTHGIELEINPTSTIRPIGVLPIDGGGLAIDKFGFTRKSNGNLGITVSFDGGTSTTVSTCTVLILLG